MTESKNENTNDMTWTKDDMKWNENQMKLHEINEWVNESNEMTRNEITWYGMTWKDMEIIWHEMNDWNEMKSNDLKIKFNWMKMKWNLMKVNEFYFTLLGLQRPSAICPHLRCSHTTRARATPYPSSCVVICHSPSSTNRSSRHSSTAATARMAPYRAAVSHCNKLYIGSTYIEARAMMSQLSGRSSQFGITLAL